MWSAKAERKRSQSLRRWARSESRGHETLLIDVGVLDPPQIARSNPTVSRERNMRLQPELALSLWRAHMDVSRFLSFVGVKVEPERSNSQHRRHAERLPRTGHDARHFRPTKMVRHGWPAAIDWNRDALQPLPAPIWALRSSRSHADFWRDALRQINVASVRTNGVHFVDGEKAGEALLYLSAGGKLTPRAPRPQRKE